MNSAIDILVPSKLETISYYVFDILKDRWDVQFSIKTHQIDQYLISIEEHKSVTFPAIFVQSENTQFLSNRSEFTLPLRELRLTTYKNTIPVLSLNTEPRNCDPIGTLFLLFSRYEEYILNGKEHQDSVNRFSHSSSLFSEYLDRPVADEIIEQLRLFLNSQLQCSIHPKESNFQVLPSHDVDRPFEFLYYNFHHLVKRMGGDLLLRKSIQEAVQRIRMMYKVKNGRLAADPNNTFDWIMSASERYGRTSTFFFLTQVTNFKYDHDYELTNPEIKDLLTKILKRNHNIGLHPSFNSSEIPGQVSKEAYILLQQLPSISESKNVLKSRYHYLRWNTKSVTELEKAQVNVDQTLGYAQQPGFRCGTSKPFPAFNFDEMRPSQLLIEPLIMMEQSLISPVYLNLRNNLPEAWNIVRDLKEKCQTYGGNFTILWHNDHLKEDELKDFYLNCIS